LSQWLYLRVLRTLLRDSRFLFKLSDLLKAEMLFLLAEQGWNLDDGRAPSCI